MAAQREQQEVPRELLIAVLSIGLCCVAASVSLFGACASPEPTPSTEQLVAAELAQQDQDQCIRDVARACKNCMPWEKIVALCSKAGK